jgi:Spy/CpxP family protein refolding chaperone
MTGFQKNWLFLMLVAVLSLGFATVAWAQPQGMGPGMGKGPGMGMEQCGMCPGMGMGHGMGKGCGMGHGMKGMMQLTPDQAAKAFDQRHKFMNDTSDLRKQMFVKQAELRQLWQAKEPDKAKIAAKQKEINAVRDQLQEKATAFKLDMRQDFPDMAGGAGCCPMMGGGKGPRACPMVPPAPEGAK